MTENLEQFKRDFLNANTWDQRKDGVPFVLLDRLSPEERQLAEDMLIEALSLKDPWPVLGLGHIRSVKALSALYSLLEEGRLAMKVNIAYAIYEINQDKKMIDLILEEFPKITDEYVLTEILHLLTLFPDARVTELLRTYRRDKRYLVAYNAAVALGESTDRVVSEFRQKRSG
jgi:hypothetical protein